MNIAIVIGVSTYLNVKDNLPGCKNDAEAIYQVLQKTEKFTPILYINSNETSAQIKLLITNFIVEHKGKSIDELFFYYSGHGEFTNDEFYYVLSDFDRKKKNQTSLQNSEIDDLFRTLSPSLVVKVVDACQSGTVYIKDSNVLTKYFRDSKEAFNKCYFFFSSLNDQSSYQEEEISYFTLSFINSLKEYSATEIRYKDIIDTISDEFQSNPDQTPFFVTQADFTEKFCSITASIKEYLKYFNQKEKVHTEVKSASLSIAELIKKDAKDYVSKEGAIEALGVVREAYDMFELNTSIKELFTLEVNFLGDFESVPAMGTIGKWVEESGKDYFAKAQYELEYDDQWNHEFQVISGIDLLVDVPFKAIAININNNYPNTFSYGAKIVILLSKKQIRFFYFVSNYEEDSWDSKQLNTKHIKWITLERKIADRNSILDGVKQINRGIQERIENDLTEKFRPKEDLDASNNEVKPGPAA